MRGMLTRLSSIVYGSWRRNFVRVLPHCVQTELVHREGLQWPSSRDLHNLFRPLSAAPNIFSSLVHHCTVAPNESRLYSTLLSSDNVIQFINSQADLEMFLRQIEELCMTGEHRKYWGQQSKKNLQGICHHLLEKNCECMNIFSFFKNNPAFLATNQENLLYNIDYLHDLGLRGNNLLYVLNQQPDIWRLKREGLQERVQQLWNIGLGDGQLKKAVLGYPPILSIKRKRFQSIVELLRKLQFSSQHISEIIAVSPQIFEEDEYQLELKFQYVLFMMGITDYKEILKAKIFNYSYGHIRLRHLALERLGLYQVPDKHGRTKGRNPSLCRIVDSADKRFATACAGISLEELNSFSQSLREELAHLEETEDGDISSDSDNE